MARLEDLQQGANVNGILPNQQVTVVNVTWFGTSVIELTYKDASGTLGSQLIYRDEEGIYKHASPLWNSGMLIERWRAPIPRSGRSVC